MDDDYNSDLEDRLETAKRKADETFAPEKTTPQKDTVNNKQEYRKGSEAAISFAVAIFFCAWIGKSIDDYFMTSPWFLLVFLCIGIVTGFYNLYKLMDN